MSTTWTPQDGERRTVASPTPAAGATTGRVHSTWNATLRTTLGAALAVTLVLLAFAWPTHTARAKDMPLGVVGTPAQVQHLATQLKAGGDAFDLTTYPDRTAAVDAIERRDAYGAIVLPAAQGKAPEVLTSSAASTVASQLLAVAAQKMGAAQAQATLAARQQAAGQAAQLGAQAAAAQATAKTLQQVSAGLPAAQAAALAPQLKAATGQSAQLAARAQSAQAAAAAITPATPTVTDVVPLAATDARGAGLAVAGLPLAMGGMIGGVMISLLVVGWKRRLVAVAGYGVLGGLLLATVLGPWFGFVPGSFGMLALVCGLAIAATASFIVGAQSLIGQPGIALGAVTTMFVGNPISGQQLPAEWLPWHWGTIGQWFVPGAAGNLMRLEAYFPAAPTGRSWLALLAWLLAGVVLTLVGRHKDDEVIHLDGHTEPDAPRHAA